MVSTVAEKELIGKLKKFLEKNKVKITECGGKLYFSNGKDGCFEVWCEVGEVFELINNEKYE